ncbi:hypothetical protein MPDQ_002968 [Monascus purpureus]|uniref:Ceramide glucosyltransferase n=1 Tax=Monascus purpureus TaxID=5098 RepID=A0A507R3B0_MONPU|nr:hypothetical protein MPDQ_002968 [Monascus purpureus]BDD59472.1 hypothetical protein MAP00_004679 [Monascus purpureus]
MLKQTLNSDAVNLGPATSHGGFSLSVATGWICLIWYIAVVAVCGLGYYQIWEYYFIQKRRKSYSSSNSQQAPRVTAIRPVKGLEPHLYDCLASTFRQDYPRDKLTIYLCVSTKDDPAFPILQKVVSDFPHVDARVYVEEEDPLLQKNENGVTDYPMGPNPKIRNMSRAYREAKGDIVWIIDCNVWVGKGVCGRMVDRLCGFGSGSSRRYKFVHHLPIVVDVDGEFWSKQEKQALLDMYTSGAIDRLRNDPSVVPRQQGEKDVGILATGGGRLEELFLSSAHAKMYTAINTVLIAPCIVGKSNMFRRSHLDSLTIPSPSDPRARNPGIDYFSDNICEDHLIGDLLWRKRTAEEKESGKDLGKHAMVFGDLAIQPTANMSVQSYIARRIRWLRVRKFTVLLATLVEPGTESIVCSLYGAWALITALADLFRRYGFSFAESLTTWKAFFWFFSLSIFVWILVDWTLYIMLHSARSIEVDEDTPVFARPIRQGRITRRPFLHWFAAWLGREILALPIWVCAVYGGVTVAWRDRRFKVGFDAKVREIESGRPFTDGSKLSVPVEASQNGRVGLVIDGRSRSPRTTEYKARQD